MTNGDIELGAGQTCFVVTPIGSGLSPIGTESRVAYEDAIQIWDKVLRPACDVFGLKAIRADKMSEPGEIPEQIFKLLRDSDVVIADLTGGNANVMYELGLRHTREMLTLQIGEYERLPFDVNTIRTIQYVRTESGLIDLRNALVESLRSGLSGHGSAVTATRIWGELEVDAALVERALAATVTSDEDEVEFDDDGRAGYVDTLAEAESSMTEIGSDMERAGAVIVGLGLMFDAGVAAIADSDRAGRGFVGRLSVARDLAEQMRGPSDELEEAGNAFREHVDKVNRGLEIIFAQLAAGEDQSDQEVTAFLSIVEQLADAAAGAAPNVASMVGTTRDLRRISTTLSDPSKRISGALNRILTSMRVIETWGERAQELRGGDGV